MNRLNNFIDRLLVGQRSQGIFLEDQSWLAIMALTMRVVFVQRRQ